MESTNIKEEAHKLIDKFSRSQSIKDKEINQLKDNQRLIC